MGGSWLRWQQHGTVFEGMATLSFIHQSSAGWPGKTTSWKANEHSIVREYLTKPLSVDWSFFTDFCFTEMCLSENQTDGMSNSIILSGNCSMFMNSLWWWNYKDYKATKSSQGKLIKVTYLTYFSPLDPPSLPFCAKTPTGANIPSFIRPDSLADLWHVPLRKLTMHYGESQTNDIIRWKNKFHQSIVCCTFTHFILGKYACLQLGNVSNWISCLAFDLFACIAVTSAGVIMYTNTAVWRINMPNTFQRGCVSYGLCLHFCCPGQHSVRAVRISKCDRVEAPGARCQVWHKVNPLKSIH